MSPKVFADIKKPAKQDRAEPFFAKISREPKPKIIIREARPWPKHLRRAATAIFSIFALLILVSAVGFLEIRKAVSVSSPSLYEKFKTAQGALLNLETQRAQDSFWEINSALEELRSKTGRYGLGSLSELWGLVVPKIKLLPETLKNLADLSGAALALTANLHQLKNSGLERLINQEGELVIENAENLEANLAEILDLSTILKNRGIETGYPLGNDFLALTVTLRRAGRALNALTNWLKLPLDKHLVLLFQNPSELRPAGGFIGSYADVVINRDGLQKLQVWDIYDPDGQLDLKIIPPKELQGITTRWGARDANWFFDFPTSAKKVISLLERSKIYSDRQITFDGAIALNVNVLETILELVGPVKLTEYETTVTAGNFLASIQREVEAGEDNRAGEPKRILKVLTPIIFQKISALNDEQKKILLREIKGHFDKKDIMLYFKDWEWQSYIEDLGAGGEIVSLGNGWQGDYLAVVGANVGGGKSDAYVTQKIKLSSKIDVEGRIDNYLIIEKTHAGDKQKDLWYRTSNRGYMKIFTPLGSRLTYLNGGELKTIQPKINYGSAGYLLDPELKSIEDTAKVIAEFRADQLEESGKTVFGTWFTVKAGETKKLELQYWNPKKLHLNNQALAYQFIFEKQSGARTNLDFLIEAPPGYLFEENQSGAFNYVTGDPPARLTIDLTLVPNLPANQR